ncbi:MAG TPA: hypothetical protein VHT23_11325 [Gemmatimonadaceae bacterium]|nr:hypothetical protein [Gemmatimonadaceae bacterium]
MRPLDGQVLHFGEVVRSIDEETPEIGRFRDPASNVFGLFQIFNV